jgi:uncharacterized repeat protein (TIGR04052 family)
MRASLVSTIGSALIIGLTLQSLAAGAANQRAVTINFGLTDDGIRVGCGASLPALGLGKVEAKLREARFYVYAVKLIDRKGGRTPLALGQNDWQYADIALIDFKDARGGNAPCSSTNPAKNAAITGTAPAGDYLGLEFSIGVPVESQIGDKTVALNHSSVETAPPPLDIQAMAWNWQAGRKFLMIEVDPPGYIAKSDGSKAKTWMVHLGSSGCKGNPATGEIVSCAYPNRFSVTLDRFNPKTEQVNLDLMTLFRESDINIDKGGAVGCMTAADDPECPTIFKAIGLNPLGAAGGASQTKPGVSPIFSVGRIATAVPGDKQ